jgi:diguanylate cyclase (GGDEF)-like protein
VSGDDRLDSPTTSRQADREELAHAWAVNVTTAAYIPRATAEIETVLLELVDELLDALGGDDPPDPVGLRVGLRLVDEGFIDPDALRATIGSLTDGLLRDIEGAPDATVARRTAALLGALSAGYADGLRRYTLTQQEQVKQALFNAMVRTEHDLRATENRFREVFTSSAVGIAITDLDGICVESNPALSQILACPPGQLAGRQLYEFFESESELGDPRAVGGVGAVRGLRGIRGIRGIRSTPGDVRAAYRSVLDGSAERVHEHRRLRKEDGETAWAFLAISLLHDGAGAPAYFVTMVQDITELQLLQDRLSHQLLYDALTGLPNRQHFASKLESTLGRMEPNGTLTLCLLNLDGFGAVNNGLGHHFGDRLLQTVGRRLEHATEGEQALVARVGPDEFAVLIEDSPATPTVDEVIGRVNAELAEAEHIDEHGVGFGASIGAIRRHAGEMSAAELFRAADTALRRAKATGRRQWAGFHAQDDGRSRERDALAAELPWAWETGQLTVAYEPVVRLGGEHETERAVAARAVLAWERADGEPLGHRDCVELAERSGMSVQLGPSLLRDVCARLPELHAALGEQPGALLRLHLTRLQSGDGDLVRAVHRAIKDTDAPANLLDIELDTAAVLDDYGDARDNLEVLTEIGVATGLCGFQGGPRELDLVADTAVSTVTLGTDGAGAAGRDTASTVLRAETERLVGVIVSGGRECAVLDVHTEAEARWWAAAGVTTVQGALFGGPVAAGNLTALTDNPRPVTAG